MVLYVPMCRRMGHLRSRLGQFGRSDLQDKAKNNDSSISHHILSMVFFAHFIIATATTSHVRAPHHPPRGLPTVGGNFPTPLTVHPNGAAHAGSVHSLMLEWAKRG